VPPHSLHVPGFHFTPTTMGPSEFRARLKMGLPDGPRRGKALGLKPFPPGGFRPHVFRHRRRAFAARLALSLGEGPLRLALIAGCFAEGFDLAVPTGLAAHGG
jgi:hypothetical protein